MTREQIQQEGDRPLPCAAQEAFRCRPDALSDDEKTILSAMVLQKGEAEAAEIFRESPEHLRDYTILKGVNSYAALGRYYLANETKLKHQSLPILERMLETLRTIRDRRLLWSEDIVSLNKKISELSSQNQTLAFLKQNGLVDPGIFISKSNELTRQLRQAKLDKEKLMAAEGDATAQRTRELIALLEDGPDFLDRPDTELCGALVAEIIVESNDTLRFRLHNGLELRESIERTVR